MVAHCGLLIPARTNWFEKSMAIQAAFLLGFQSESAEFPVAYQVGAVAAGARVIPIPTSFDALAALVEAPPAATPPPVDYVAAIPPAQQEECLAPQVTQGLEGLFALGAFLKDHNGDLLADETDFTIVLDEAAPPAVLVAACQFAFRFGMETTGATGMLAAQEYHGGNALLFHQGDSCRIYMEQGDGGVVVHVEGAGTALEDFSAKLCEEFPLLSPFETWTERLHEMRAALAMTTLDGQLAYLESNKDAGFLHCFVDPEIEVRAQAVTQRFPRAQVQSYKTPKTQYEATYNIPWEVDEVRDILTTKLFPQLRQGDSVSVFAALSEDKGTRARFQQELTTTLGELGVEVAHTQVLCAYKQGFSWLEEYILPALQKLEGIEKISIAFKEFLPPDVAQWGDESGAIPRRTQLEDDPARWFDLPIRYLQELYPIEDILIQPLGLQRNQMEFVLYKGDEDITYHVQVTNARGEALLLADYKATCAERFYLDAYPELGKVHPSTGYVRALVNGQLLLDEAVKTDLERIWDIYQRRVLPECYAFLSAKGTRPMTPANQPFFSQLRLEITASEPDDVLPCRQDSLSSLDAFHEDLYFVGMDYFKRLGTQLCAAPFDAPGLILPLIKKGTGGPTFQVSLLQQPATAPQLSINGMGAKAPPAVDEIGLSITEISCVAGEWCATLLVSGVEEAVVAAYAALLDEQFILQNRPFGRMGRMVLATAQNQYAASLPAPPPQAPALDIRDIDLHGDSILGYEEYLDIIHQLKRVSGLSVYQTATSYLGRAIYAIELTPTGRGYHSRTKRITNRPSEIINCRHHANEASSTNAALSLLRTLLLAPEFEHLPQQLNLVIVPLENVDGTAIHHQLQRENPRWKLHVARFNALGKEFFSEHFNRDTLHTEAHSMTRLFHHLLPDVIVDSHGVPSHEWDQQFSGYVSPSFKGFWLPRALLYGYFWISGQEQYQSNLALNREMERVIAVAINKDAEMVSWNEQWARQFETYAHRWMPELFPAHYHEGMINYWITHHEGGYHNYFSTRFPWIVTAWYTSEVADETAHGDYLALCARTHQTHMLAVIRMLRCAQKSYEHRVDITPDHVQVRHCRLRPLLPAAPEWSEAGKNKL